MTTPDLDEERYATLLEEAFIAERGTPFLLSPKDWLLIRSWRERGVPADTVIRAVHETFERRRSRGAAGKISSLAYCENAVEERWELERRGLAGAHGGREAAAVSTAEALASLRAAVEAVAPDPAFANALARAKEKLATLSPGTPGDELEEALLAIETSLARAVKKALTDEQAAALETRVAADLGDMTGISTQVVERTRRALERRELRRLAGIPALSLF